jgi:hypothetical protein
VPKQKAEKKNLYGLKQERKPGYILWAELLKRTFQVDSLKCDDCGYLLEAIAVIKDKKVIESILKCVGEKMHDTDPNPPRGRGGHQMVVLKVIPKSTHHFLTPLPSIKKLRRPPMPTHLNKSKSH